MGQQPGILVSGMQVVLRDRLPSDVDQYLRWQTSGEWGFCRSGLETWSLNPRMMRVAEKVGFVYEGEEEGASYLARRAPQPGSLWHFAQRVEAHASPHVTRAGSQSGTLGLLARSSAGIALVNP